MANEFKVKNGLIVIGDLTTSGTITINGALAATQSWVTSQAYLTSASLSGYATQSYVTSAISALIDAAPAALDTLNELAAALGDDANFSTTITNSIASKLPLAGGTLTGDLNLNYGYPRINFYDDNHNPDYSLINNDGGFSLYDITNNVHRLWVSAIGNVGIGTTSPVSPLDVNGIISSRGIFIAQNSGTYNVIYNASNSVAMYLGGSGDQNSYYDNNSHFFRNAGGGTTFGRWNSTGLGIGTTSPSYKLDVVGEARFGNNYNAIVGDDGTYGGYSTIGFGGTSNGYNRVFGQTGTSDGLFLAAATGRGIYFRVNGGSTDNMYLSSSGNLGIGTTSPSSKLTVYSDTTADGILVDVLSRPRITLRDRGNSDTIIGTGDYGLDDFFIDTYSGNAFAIKGSTRNVGIGTTSPATPLHVTGGASGSGGWNRTATLAATYPGLIFNSNGTKWGGMAYDYSAAMRFWVNANNDDIFAGTLAMSILNNGNVGIGTSDPSYKLDVAGEGKVTGKFRVGGAVMLAEPGTGVLLFGSEGGNQTAIYSASAEAIRINTAGDVGIGNTSPNDKLDVSGNVSANAFNAVGTLARYNGTGGVAIAGLGGSSYAYIKAYSNSGGTGKNLALQQDGGNVGIGTTSPGAPLDVNGSLNSGKSIIRVTNSDTANYITLGAGIPGVSNAGMNFTLDGSSKMVISAGGNVGIGTTSPSQKLDVAGGDIILSSNATYIRSKDASGNTPRMFGINPSNDTYIGPIDSYAGGAVFYGVSANVASQTFYTGATARLHIASGGNVGIGTTTPTHRLTVAGGNVLMFPSDNTRQLSFFNDSYGITASSGLELITGDYIRFRQGSTELARLTTTGLGIGTASPSEKLYVNSGGAYMDTTVSYGTNTKGIVINQEDGTGYGTGVWFRQAGLTAGIGSTRVSSGNWATDLRFYTHPASTTNQNTLYEAMRINSEGKVSIGTTSTNSDQSDFTVYTGGTTTLALSGGEFRVGDTDVNWSIALRQNGFLETYAQPLYLRTITGSQPVVIGPDGTNTVEFYPDYTLFNGLNLAISRTNSTHGAGNYFRGDASHLVIGTGGTLYLNYGGGTTIITGNTTVSGLLGVTGIVSANARKLSLGILDLNTSGVPGQFKIKTSIPWNYGGSDFTVNIKGFRYGSSQMVSLSIGWHFYNNEFYSRNAICNGAWAPTISLAKSPDGYVIIHLPSPDYWAKLYVESVYSSNSADSYTSGWSWSDADLSDCTLIQTVPYRDLATNISGNAATATFATTAGALSSMNISQFTNNSGYITSYTETDTLQSVTSRGATTTNRLEFQYSVDRYSQAWRNTSTGAYWWVTTDSDKLGLHLNGDGDKFYFGNNGDFYSTANGWLSSALAAKQNAATAINTSNIGSQSVSYANSAGEAGQVTNQTGQLLRFDNRIISPSETTAGYLQFGFTSWTNDNNAPYADYLHLRSYTDGSGGNDNLVMFLKSGIGMRIYQQTFGSATAYSSYADVWTSANFTSTNVSNWNTAYGWGNHASQGYATTSYVTTQINNLINGAPGALDTLDELAAALGDDANFATTVTNSIAGKVSKAGDTMTGNINWDTQNTGLTWNMNTDGAYIKFFNTGDGDTNSRLEYSTSDNGDEYHRWVIAGVEKMNLKWGGLTVTDTIYASGGNSGNWNTAYGWGDHSSVGYALNSSLANYLPLSGGVIGGAVTINGNLTVNGTITENSSIKLKENVETSEGNLEKVVNLRPVTYNKIGSQTTELGLIAEEVAEVYPEFVQYDENGEPVGVHYSRLTAALIGAVKELNEQLQELKRNK